MDGSVVCLLKVLGKFFRQDNASSYSWARLEDSSLSLVLNAVHLPGPGPSYYIEQTLLLALEHTLALPMQDAGSQVTDAICEAAYRAFEFLLFIQR